MKSSKSTWTIVLGLFFLTIGVLILLDNLNIVYFHTVWSVIWPLLLIIFGFILIFRNRARVVPKVREIDITEEGTTHEKVTYTVIDEQGEETTTNSSGTNYVNDNKHQSHFFGELNYKTKDQNFKGLNASNVFGDINVDISDIDIDQGEQTVNISGIFGSIKIKIPPNIPVKFIGSNIVGSVNFMDQTRDGILANLNSQSEDYNSASKKVFIRASIIFGEITAE